MYQQYQKIEIGKYLFACYFTNETTCIEVQDPQKVDQIYFGKFSNDTIPQNFKMLFPTSFDLYQYLSTSSKERVAIEQPNTIKISYFIFKPMIAQLPLSHRQLTREQVVLNDLKKKQRIIYELRSKINSNEEIKSIKQLLIEKEAKIQDFQNNLNQMQFQIILLQEAVENKNKENQNLKKRNEQLEKQISRLLRVEQEQRQMIVMLHRENEEKNQLLQFLENEKVGKLNLFDIEKEIELKIGKPVKFKPLKTNQNKKYFDFSNNILTKNQQSANGTGKMIVSQDPIIPNSGRFHLKIKNKNFNGFPNFRIGLIGKQNIDKESYVNGGDQDCVMYYCYNKEKEMVWQGNTRIEAFTIEKDHVVTIVVNSNNQTIYWYLNGDQKVKSQYTKSMKKVGKIYFFVQLWATGDQLEFT